MHLDASLLMLVSVIAVVLVAGLVLQLLRQPQVVAYLVGIILGPHVSGLVVDTELMARLGATSVVLLLFFVGMEVAPEQLLSNWRIAIIGTVTVIQVVLSVAAVGMLGWWLTQPGCWSAPLAKPSGCIGVSTRFE